MVVLALVVVHKVLALPVAVLLQLQGVLPAATTAGEEPDDVPLLVAGTGYEVPLSG